MGNILIRKYNVGSGETDLFNRLRPSSLLAFLQDAATLHAEELNLSRDELIGSTGGIWVMSRLWYELYENIPGGVTLEVKTWHRGAKGTFFYRDFEISVGGVAKGRAVSAWLVVDKEKRRIIRPSVLEDVSELGMVENGYDIELGRIKPKVCLKEIMKRRVNYSDLDINRHLNNTKYMDIICDAMHMEDMTGKYINCFQINYIGECRAGEEISIIAGKEDENVYLTGIDLEKKARFESVVSLCSE